MVMCKYFLQGTCRFGSSCNFEHQINTEHSYGARPQPQQPSGFANVDTATIVKMIVNDMKSAEKGGQWLLSSYSPFKEKPPFPGFEDHSMEEIRFLFLEAVKNGTVEQLKQNLQVMLQQAMIRIKALQNPSPDAMNVLRQIYNTPPSSSSAAGSFQNQYTGVFATNTPSIFGGGATATVTPIVNTPDSIFGNQQKPQQNSIFGGTNSNVFKSQPQNNSIFGGQTQTNPSNVFVGQASQNSSVFGVGGGGSSSIFGGGQSTNVFQVAPVNTQQSVFGNNQNLTIFGNSTQQTTQQSIFGPPPSQSQPIFGGGQIQQQTQSIFGGTQPQQQAPQSIFGGGQVQPKQQPNIFNNQPPVDVFQQQQQIQQPQIAFAPQPLALQAQQQNPNIYGAVPTAIAQNNSTKAFGVGTNLQDRANDSRYSKLSDFTQEEIDWFNNDDLDISKIPDKPPPYELCFKS